MIRTTLLCLVFALACSAAERPSTQKRGSTSAKASAQTPRAAAQVSVPKDAVPAEPGIWRWTDQAGRKWIFRKTPFGVAKYADEPDKRPDPGAAKLAEITSAAERGDEIAFERSGPFGTYRWQRKKTELSDMEKTAWERTRNRSRDGGDAGRE